MVRKRRLQAEQGRQPPCFCVCPFRSHTVADYTAPAGALDSYSARQLLETFVMLRREYAATVLMVTHDALSASYCDRILFMRDGEIIASLERGQESKQEFFAGILEVIARMAGGDRDVS